MTTTTRPLRARARRARGVRGTIDTRVLLATAGEPESTGATHVAAAIASRYGAPVLALGVSTPFPHNISTMVSLRQPVSIDEQSRREVLELVRKSTQRVPEAEHWEKRAMIGNPPDVINDVAKRWGATLIVVGLGRHKRIDRVFGSETAIGVIKGARVPVLAVPARMRELPKSAVAAIDFTPASIRAAVAAADLLSDDGTLTLVHVCGFAGVPAHPGDIVDLYRAGALAKLDLAERTVRRSTKRTVSSMMIEGDPGVEIVKYARERRSDLIALGGHALGLMDRILIGSVRTRVVRDATCAVVVVPPAPET